MVFPAFSSQGYGDFAYGELTRPLTLKVASIQVMTSMGIKMVGDSFINEVIFSSVVCSIEVSSKRNEATRLSKLFHDLFHQPHDIRKTSSH